MPTMKEKLELAKQALGPNWVLAKKSTYDARRRAAGSMCATLRNVVVKAMKEKRL